MTAHPGRQPPRHYYRPARLQLSVLQALELLEAEGPQACTVTRIASASGLTIGQARNVVIQLRKKKRIVGLPLDGTSQRGYWRTPA